MENNRRRNHPQVKKRIEALVKKAEEGDLDSIFLLAYIYANGEYLPKDCLAAEAWLRKAVEMDSNRAKKELAELLTNGNGLAQNYDEAFDLYQELMFDCDLDGMAGVGMAYKLGRGIGKDEQKASFYLNHAFQIELDLMEDEPSSSE